MSASEVRKINFFPTPLVYFSCFPEVPDLIIDIRTGKQDKNTNSKNTFQAADALLNFT